MPGQKHTLSFQLLILSTVKLGSLLMSDVLVLSIFELRTLLMDVVLILGTVERAHSWVTQNSK